MKALAKRIINSCGYDIRPAHFSRGVPVPANSFTHLLPSISSTDLLSGAERVAVLEPEAVNGNVSLLELLVINTLICRHRARRLFEFGTFDGRTSLNMIANATLDAELYTLDLPKADINHTEYTLHENDRQYIDKQASGLRYSARRWAPRIHQLFGDSATFDYSPYQRKMDFIFVDGSHQYDYIKSDTDAALRMAAPGATLIWHDYQLCWPDVVRFLHECYASGGLFSGLRHVDATSVVYLEMSP